MEGIEKRKTEAIDRLRALGEIHTDLKTWRTQFLSSPDFDPESAASLNSERGLKFSVLAMSLDVLFPNAQFHISQGKLCAGRSA